MPPHGAQLRLRYSLLLPDVPSAVCPLGHGTIYPFSPVEQVDASLAQPVSCAHEQEADALLSLDGTTRVALQSLANSKWTECIHFVPCLS